MVGFFVFAAVWLLNIDLLHLVTMFGGTVVAACVGFAVYLVVSQEKVLYIPVRANAPPRPATPTSCLA